MREFSEDRRIQGAWGDKRGLFARRRYRATRGGYAFVRQSRGRSGVRGEIARDSSADRHAIELGENESARGRELWCADCLLRTDRSSARSCLCRGDQENRRDVDSFIRE